MNEQIRIVLVVALLGFGSYGWGALLLGGLGGSRRTPRDGDPTRREIVTETSQPSHALGLQVPGDSWPVTVVVGMAAFLGVAGVLVATNSARIGPLVGFHLIGVVLALVACARGVRRRERSGRSRIRQGTAVVLWALYGAATTVAALAASASFVLNINDDDPAYLYFAQRLLSTGGLIDPFNNRRITSYGGASVYQAIFLRIAGNESLQAFDLVFGALLLIALVVGTRRRPLWFIGAVLVAASVIFGHGAGPIANLSPRYSSAVLVLGGALVLVRIDAPGRSRRAELWRCALGGATLAACVSFRTQIVLPGVLAALVVVVRPPGWRPRLARLGALVAGAVVGLGGWAVALNRSSRTPLFPIVRGNFSGHPAAIEPGITAAFYLRLLGRLLAQDGTGLLVAAAVAVGVWMVLRRPRNSVEAVVTLTVAIGCAVGCALNALFFSSSQLFDVTRYTAPTDLAGGLLALDLLWREPQRPTTTAGETGAPRHLPPGGDRRWALVNGGFVVVAILVAVVGSVPTTVKASVRGDLQALRAAAKVSGIPDRYAQLRPEYAKLNAAIPTGARVISAVDFPALLDFTKFDVTTLDLPGVASSPPGMPFFKGPAAQLTYLQNAGFTFLAYSSPNGLGLYEAAQWLNTVRSPIYYSRELALYMLDWLTLPPYLAQEGYTSFTFGDLTLVQIGS